jgi:hypothetical protein
MTRRPRRNPPQQFCEPHRLLRGSHIPAEHLVGGTWMCTACRDGKDLPAGRRQDATGDDSSASEARPRGGHDSGRGAR